ncbi:MAG: glycosyltransferase family 2 protein [Kiritimatiellia bacterium]
MSEIRVSVVIPCFNDGKYLLEAVASVERCGRSDAEIIIVDDGSTDPMTLQVFESLERRTLCVFHHSQQRGLAHARNTGVRHAQGLYILPLDADNRIRPAYLNLGIQILDACPDVGVVYGDRDFFGAVEGKNTVGEFDLAKLLLEQNYIDACALYRKHVWEQCGGYDPNMPIQGLEDWDFWLSVVEKGWKFHYIPEVLFDYRKRSDSMVQKNFTPENLRRVRQYVYLKHFDLLKAEIDRLRWEENRLRERVRRLESSRLVKLISRIHQLLYSGKERDS